MAESYINITEGSGKKLHSNSRSIAGSTVEDEVIVQGEQYLPSYAVLAGAQAAVTANDHAFQIMAGSVLNVRIRSFYIDLNAATAAGLCSIGLVRLSTAGTGGVAVTPTLMDPSDAASGATAMTTPTAKGTESGNLFQRAAFQTSATAPQPAGQRYIWPSPGSIRSKPIIIPVGVTNGLAWKVVGTGAAGSLVNIWVEFDESAF